MKKLQLEYPEIGDDTNDLWYYDEEEEITEKDEEETKFVKQLFNI